jgi:diguanylate cyclase (GGDEF)-like protein
MPRITGRIFKDLLVWMLGMGLLIGLAMPLTELAMGESMAHVFNPLHMLVSLTVGALLGLANFFVAQSVIRPILRRMARSMQNVENSFREASFTGEWERCREEVQAVDPVNQDEIGTTTSAFNQLVEELIRVNTLGQISSDLAEGLNSQLELSDLGQMATDFLIKNTDASAVSILAHVDDALSVVANHGIREPACLLSSAEVQRTLKTNEMQIARVAPYVVVEKTIVDFHPQQMIFVPISFHDKALGVAVLANDKIFSKDAMWILQVFQRGMGLALSNALSHDNLQKLATLDPLTGIFNRRQGMRLLREEFVNVAQSHGSLGVLMFDVDHFKRVNDTYGHAVGDRVLIAICRSAEKVFRDSDALIRAGGEEFMAILPGVSPAVLEKIGERLRKAISDTVVEADGEQISVTVSVGLSSFRSDESRQEEDLIKKADEALYRAKETGRNRVVLSDVMNIKSGHNVPIMQAMPTI